MAATRPQGSRTGNLLMTFEIYRGLFCVLIGISWGVVYFGFKLLTGSTGGIGAVGDGNEEGGVKFLSLWNPVPPTIEGWYVGRLCR